MRRLFTPARSSLVFALRPVHFPAPPAPRKIARLFTPSSRARVRAFNTMSAPSTAAAAAKAAYETAAGQPSIAGAMITASTATSAHVSR